MILERTQARLNEQSDVEEDCVQCGIDIPPLEKHAARPALAGERQHGRRVVRTCARCVCEQEERAAEAEVDARCT